MTLLKSNDFWKPNTYYYSTDRYKSLIEHNNTLYICNESHLSQDEFDDSKFTSMGSDSGSSGLIPAGDWDIDATLTVGAPALTTPKLSIPFGSNITNNSELPQIDYDGGCNDCQCNDTKQLVLVHLMSQ